MRRQFLTRDLESLKDNNGGESVRSLNMKPFRNDAPEQVSLGAASEEEFTARRAEMIERQLRRRGVNDARLLAAMAAVRREEFVPAEFRQRAYEDAPLPIGEGQTISQPYIAGAMTAALRLKGDERLLEIGTGCGYQAAVLSHLAKIVFTIESRSELAASAAARLERLGYKNVHVHCGDGTLGLPELAPFDAILVAAAAPGVPEPLRSQLGEASRLILPVGDAENQELQLIERQGNTFTRQSLEYCRFVPLVGLHGWKEPPR
jgi:protein-L-isoaspartate(D-aspartate) O-methyltransferase